MLLHHCEEPSAGATISVLTFFFGSSTTSACLSLVLYAETPSLWVDFVAAFASP